MEVIFKYALHEKKGKGSIVCWPLHFFFDEWYGICKQMYGIFYASCKQDALSLQHTSVTSIKRLSLAEFNDE